MLIGEELVAQKAEGQSSIEAALQAKEEEHAALTERFAAMKEKVKTRPFYYSFASCSCSLSLS